ncbi:hypothetical protein LQG66_00055 [Bradyrhizobium ontarionense]|uniref:Uncharacterized protein n=1 Tax=Bradyrhizobium ontarionense TaxID=2898149 RepID=A0ABY3RDD1_9BRAD|nr:hypothetical protein [Bradyrhizobium sp. A19]UFZ04762.1 hypothetical protein LQG66_00055 [Bradyrhizobium sp. A19]
MKKSIGTLLLVAALSAAAAVDANAWTRSGSVTGPRGTASFGGSGSCSGGACSWQGGGTGPAGNSWSRSGSASCSGGSCTRQGQGTGPRGNAYSYSRTVTR